MTFKTIAVIGEGKMGTNLFHFLADFPFELRWICSPGADVEKLRKSWARKNARSTDLGILTEDECRRRMRAVISSDISDTKDCDLVVEAIPENKDRKLDLFHALDAVAPAGCILASNSSSILPSGLIASDRRATTTIGLHFFYPVELKNIAELVITPGISEETILRTTEFLQLLGKQFLLQNSEEAFVLNRIFLEVQLEAWNLAEEGPATPAQIDHLIREHLFPIGAFECFDSVGIDIMLPSVVNYSRLDPDPRRFSALTLQLQRLLAAGKTGRNAGTGFLNYDAGTEAEAALSEKTRELIYERIRRALSGAVQKYSHSSTYTVDALLGALQEYLGISNLGKLLSDIARA